VEVAREYHKAVKMYWLKLSFAVCVHSVVVSKTPEALWSIHESAVIIPVGRRILMGNKRDLAKESWVSWRGSG